MKIAIICYYHIDATISLVKYLKQRDKDLEIDFICLFSQQDKNATPISFQDKSVPNGFLNEDDIQKVVDVEIINYLKGIARLKIFLFSSYKIFHLQNFLQIIKLRNNFKHEKYDVINFVGNHRVVIALSILTKIKVKFHTIHEPFPHHNFFSKSQLLERKILMNLLIKSGCHITVPSVVSYERFISNYKVDLNKISIIYFSQLEIYKEYLKVKIQKSDQTLLFCGLINKYKSVEVLISAMEKVVKVIPDLKLIIAGKGKINYNLSTLGESFEIINRYITNKEIAELNSVASLVVCPYISASQSGVIMTSFAFNNPVLATSVGSIPEFVDDGKTGILIDYLNSDMLADKILEFFNNPKKINEFRINITNKYSKTDNSWESIADKYYRLIQNHLE
jgi:glycosyltransferase involved in cell wall biosynthesis